MKVLFAICLAIILSLGAFTLQAKPGGGGYPNEGHEVITRYYSTCYLTTQVGMSINNTCTGVYTHTGLTTVHYTNWVTMFPTCPSDPM